MIWECNSLRLSRLTHALLLNRTDLAERSSILLKAIQDASLDWLVHFATNALGEYLQSQDARSPISPEECVMTRNAAEKIKHVALERIRVAAEDGSIIKVKDLESVLIRWHPEFSRRSTGIARYPCSSRRPAPQLDAAAPPSA